ncbi:sensor histidine kinase [Aminobacter aminovorans]|jgi:signal transduction histidine kinase|uniref:histidine kinase n=1 Tax=Aminobacter aminovorans TaxID=83263 RepID=A0AAC8YRC9_AMIAI|nr:HAMP domain-containing sensor histidine kinase [Aminobacter aminovorans]AMS43160.1 histidine kinase [Aminobacter aminovorans]MBB3706293.1 signal transduction histidine kinase [Aminobacter aminovorans]WMC99020.1 HAMP domain-containing sensor histidine kinase [Aminobacter aminovorans]
MRFFGRLRTIPVSYRVPVLVALLMVAISVVISERVLDRLSRTQESFLDGLAGSYLDGLTAAVLPAVLRGDVWEVFDALDRSRKSYEALSPIEAVVTGADGKVLAATDPTRIPSFSDLPEAYASRYGASTVTFDRDSATGFAHRDLVYQGQPVGAIHTAFDASHIFAERREILVTLLVTNGILAAVFAFGGFLLVRRMIEPMRVLEDHMRAAANGVAEPIPSAEFPARGGEVASLFNGYNALVHAERERANFAMQLAEEEKLASLGRLASGMAHEINNPLGGLFNAIDTLKTHGRTPGVRDTSISLIERGLHGIREVVEAALATYRPERSARPLSADDLEDVKVLMKPELRRRRQRLDWQVDWPADAAATIPGGPVRQAVLNLLLNASAATPEGGRIGLKVERTADRLKISVSDEGPGMPRESISMLSDDDPGPAVRVGRGLGLWMARRMVDACGGKATVEPAQSSGSIVTLILPIREEAKHENSRAA